MRAYMGIMVVFVAFLIAGTDARAESVWIGTGERTMLQELGRFEGPDTSRVSDDWEEFLSDSRMSLGFVWTEYDSSLHWRTGGGGRFLWEKPLKLEPIPILLDVDIQINDSDTESDDSDLTEYRAGTGITFDLFRHPLFTFGPRILIGGSWIDVEDHRESGWYASLETDLRFRLDEQLDLIITPGISWVDNNNLVDGEDSFLNRHLTLGFTWRF